MFYVSALLLDDALKTATPLTNGAINENQLKLRRTKIAVFLGHPDVLPAGCNRAYTLGSN